MLPSNQTARHRAWVYAEYMKELLDREGRSRLHDAVIDGKIEDLTSALREGADVNLKDNKGWTPLHFAAQEYYVNIAQLLIRHGADVNAQDNYGNTALF